MSIWIVELQHWWWHACRVDVDRRISKDWNSRSQSVHWLYISAHECVQHKQCQSPNVDIQYVYLQCQNMHVDNLQDTVELQVNFFSERGRKTLGHWYRSYAMKWTGSGSEYPIIMLLIYIRTFGVQLRDDMWQRSNIRLLEHASFSRSKSSNDYQMINLTDQWLRSRYYHSRPFSNISEIYMNIMLLK